MVIEQFGIHGYHIFGNSIRPHGTFLDCVLPFLLITASY
jgi:hypothetical protein